MNKFLTIIFALSIAVNLYQAMNKNAYQINMYRAQNNESRVMFELKTCRGKIKDILEGYKTAKSYKDIFEGE